MALYNVNCAGNKLSIAYCSHNGWGNKNCGHQEDAGAWCKN